MILIASITDDGNDAASITTQGSVNGSLLFYAGRKPYTPGSAGTDAAPLTFTGSGPYGVTFAAPGLWYVWTHDNDGYSPLFAVWMGETSGMFTAYSDELADALQGILVDNLPGINAKISQVYPNVTVKQVVKGFGAMVEEWPAIVIVDPDFTQDWAFMPYGRVVGFSARIVCCVYHNELPTEEKLVMKMAGAVAFLLSQPAYNDVTLPSGVILRGCLAQRGRYYEEGSADAGWVSGYDVYWGGAEGVIQVSA